MTALGVGSYRRCGITPPGLLTLGYFFALAFLRSAQYFFIRAETAFFCAADILERLRF